MSHMDGDPSGAQAVEDGDLAQIAAGDRVAHLRQREGDGAHAWPADADDVVPAPARQVERRCHPPATSSISSASRPPWWMRPAVRAASAIAGSAAGSP